MGRAIWKFEVPIEGAALDMPVGAKILHVGAASTPASVLFWAEVNNEPEAHERRFFYVVGTGHEIHDSGVYVGSCFPGLGLVWHLIETVI